jgi:hypothetical protein
MTETDPLLFADEVAELTKTLPGKPIEQRSVIFYASQSRRRARAGTLTEYDLPVPRAEDYATREQPTTQARCPVCRRRGVRGVNSGPPSYTLTLGEHKAGGAVCPGSGRTVGGAVRHPRQPRWRKSVIVAWRAAMAGRPAPQRDRDQETGQYLRKVAS